MLGSGVDYLRQKLLDNSESDLILHIARPPKAQRGHADLLGHTEHSV